MGFVLGLAQCGYPGDGNVVAQVGRFAKEASQRGVNLLVFPEDLMSPRRLEPSELWRIAQPLDGGFVGAIAACAVQHGLWVAFTTYEADPEGGAPFNTAVVLDDGGCVRTTYRKCHLYDAHGVRESDRNKAGSSLCEPIDTPFGRLGLAICYDLRFPEVARHAALKGCEVLLYPSAWHDGPCKAEHWETLLRARAIKNELFVVGVGKAGDRFVGRSLVADPLGRTVVAASDASEQLLTCELDLAQIARARDAMPLLRHRRDDLYGALVDAG